MKKHARYSPRAKVPWYAKAIIFALVFLIGMMIGSHIIRLAEYESLSNINSREAIGGTF